MTHIGFLTSYSCDMCSSSSSMSAEPNLNKDRVVSTTSLNNSTSSSPVKVIKGASGRYVKLNVGGSLFYTTMGNLTKQDNMLRAMFSGRMEVLTDSEGWVLIDRCGKHFGVLLTYLRDGTIPLPPSQTDVEEVMAEAKYFLIQGLVDLCAETLTKMMTDSDPICRVPVITSFREEHDLITHSNKPVVKLLYNRQNNKYSYTSQSDDNLLKNIELFDKLSLRFNGRILFVKDVIGTNEICCWSYFGNGRKVAEVCCTSIVYATEKKQTKVEFPEARIYEETLNVLLYEKGSCPDAELMMATRGKVGSGQQAHQGAHHLVSYPALTHPSAIVHSDEDEDHHRPHGSRRY